MDDYTATSNRIKNITIVGGGSAGWMVAAALSTMLKPPHVQITLVESDAIGTVGVGEATIPDIINFNRMLGIKEADFLKATDGTFKLGIEFVNWGAKGERYFHPFGSHGSDMGGVDFHQYWLSRRVAGDRFRLEDYSMCAVAAYADKFTLPVNDRRTPVSEIRYAYHLDATKYAQFLRKYAEKNGVNRVEGRVTKVNQNAQTGFITDIELESGAKIEGDLFFDCTGFRSLLLGQTLGVAHKDWSKWLACDSAVTVACEHNGPLKPYTIATARDAGWQWRIPTQRRTGNGHIFSSQFTTAEAASDVLMNSLDGAPLGKPRQINFKTGHRETFWEKNCVAVGLSAGFLEPLESTSLFLIQEGVSKFLSLFPTKDMSPVSRGEYNRLLTQKFEQVRDFIILHYKATQREDTPFWRYCKHMDIPESLSHKLALFQEAGRVFRYEDELFAKDSWVAVMVGQNIVPQRVDPIVAGVDANQITHSLTSMRAAMLNTAQKMPTHAEFIRSYAPSSAKI